MVVPVARGAPDSRQFCIGQHSLAAGLGRRLGRERDRVGVLQARHDGPCPHRRQAGSHPVRRHATRPLGGACQQPGNLAPVHFGRDMAVQGLGVLHPLSPAQMPLRLGEGAWAHALLRGCKIAFDQLADAHRFPRLLARGLLVALRVAAEPNLRKQVACLGARRFSLTPSGSPSDNRRCAPPWFDTARHSAARRTRGTAGRTRAVHRPNRTPRRGQAGRQAARSSPA